jgi:jumonji domain-containing protein 7
VALSPVFIALLIIVENDNLRNEYAPLFDDVPKSVPFARIALQREPDAINFWLGNSRSVTALHKDPYENIYVQILGRKHFVLMPPVEFVCVNERLHTAGTFCKMGPTTSDNINDTMLQPLRDTPDSKVPFATFDPAQPDRNVTAFSSLSRPQKVTLHIGDMLYLPAQWYHKVLQSCSEEGICCAVNYWYDMDYSGSLYPLTNFAKKVGSLVI